MNEKQARQLATHILYEFEVLPVMKNVIIPSDDRKGSDEEAYLYECKY